MISKTWEHLENYAEKGLRTLVCCEKVIDKRDYGVWALKYHVY